MNNDQIKRILRQNNIRHTEVNGRIIAKDKYGIWIDVTGYFKIELKLWIGY